MYQSDPTPVKAYDLPLVIGVISDTHINAFGARQLPPQVLSLFQRAAVELILHLGDINTPEVLDDLATVAPVLAVYGNNDSPQLLEELPGEIRLQVGPFTIGMLHGHGGRSARHHTIETLAGKVDLACFGHSHIPWIGEEAGTMLFNPGSATDRRWHEHFGVGVITISADGINPELILYTDPRHLDGIRFD